MTKLDGISAGFGVCVLALSAVLATAAVAQTAAGPANTAGNMPDMRLWSFGECDNRFPFVNSNEHKECVRVVGSEEARDARALRICETSNPRDPEEVARCKATYHRNKQASAQSGFVPNANGAAQTQAPPSEEELKRVKAIAAAAVERDREAARAAVVAAEPDEPIVAPDEEESGFPMSLLIAFGFTALLLGALAANRRKHGGAIFGR